MSEASKRGRQNSNSDESPTVKRTALVPEGMVQIPVLPAKVIKLEHLFEDVSTLDDDEDDVSGCWEDHFGFDWRIFLRREDEYLKVYIEVKSGKVRVEGEMKINLIGHTSNSTAKQRSEQFNVDRGEEAFISYGHAMLEWDKLSEFTSNDKLYVRIEFGITFMGKLDSNDPSKFDVSKSKVSDCILVADNQKFFVSRYFLATHSPFFESLLLGPYKEANMPEVQLPGLDPYDVENFLRVIYGYEAVNGHNVEALLLMSDKHDTPIIKEKCEEYLVMESGKTVGKIFEMFLKYQCNMDKIIDEITTLDEYKKVIGGDIDSFDHELAKKLLKKGAEILSG